MVKDVKDDLEENLEKTPEPAATKEGQVNDPGPSSDPSSGPSSDFSSPTKKVENKYLYFFSLIVNINFVISGPNGHRHHRQPNGHEEVQC